MFEDAEAANRKEKEDLAARFDDLNKKADDAAAAAKKAADDKAKAADKIPKTLDEARPEDIDDALISMQCNKGYPLYLETRNFKYRGQYVCGKGCCYSKEAVLKRIQEKKLGRMDI